jgi:hypothetical protein
MNIMNSDEKFKIYDRVMAVIVIIAVVAMLLTSCTTSRHSGYQDHLRSTHHTNWVKQDNGGCGWHN